MSAPTLDGCEEFDRRLIDSLVSPSPDAALDRHLADCARCRRARDHYLATLEGLSAAFALGDADAADTTERTIAQASPSKRLLWRRSLVLVLPAFAAAAMLFFLAQWLRPTGLIIETQPGATIVRIDLTTARIETGTATFRLHGSGEVQTPLGELRGHDSHFRVTVHHPQEASDVIHPRTTAISASITVAALAGVIYFTTPDEHISLHEGDVLHRDAQPPLADAKTDIPLPVMDPVKEREGILEDREPKPPKTATPWSGPTRLNGQVRAQKTRRPVPGLELALVASNGDSTSLGMTSKKGWFSARVSLDAGVYDLVARHPNHRSLSASGDHDLLLMTASLGEYHNQRLKLEYPWNGSLEGRVLDDRGQPLGAVALFPHLSGWRLGAEPSGEPSTLTDRRGRFEIGFLPTNIPIRLTAIANGFLRHESRDFVVTPKTKKLEITLRMGEGVSLPVQVRLASGKPAESVSLELRGQDHPISRWTDPQGRCRFDVLSHQTYELVAIGRHGHPEPRELARETVVVGAEAPQEVLVWILDDDRSLYGNVTFVDPRPRGLSVALRRNDLPDANVHRINVGKDATFNFYGLEIGGYDIWLEAFGPGLRTRPMSIMVPTGPIQVPWSSPRSTRLVLQVVDPDGSVIPGAELRLTETRKDGRRSTYHDETDARGRASFETTTGQLHLAVFARGFAESDEDLRLSLDQDEHHKTITLKKGGVVRGLVVDGEGQPLQGVRVARFERRSQLDTTIVLTDENGRFEIDSIPEKGGEIGLVDVTLPETIMVRPGDDVTLTRR